MENVGNWHFLIFQHIHPQRLKAPSCDAEKGKVDNEFVDGVRICYCHEDKFQKNDLFKKHSFLLSLILYNQSFLWLKNTSNR